MSEMTPIRDPHKDALITPENAVIAFIDYQPEQYAGVRSVGHEDLLAEELRIAARFMTLTEARKVQYFASQLPCNGPAGGAWGRPIDQGGVEEIITFYSTRLPHDAIRYELHTLAS